ncbi:hypothetical protein HPP92_018036 [Vanilla planifolia]|uniref:Non-haem dioxygenase N-terminal domain-containing protein n=1 Tax=Vanilla planifolia TaxID=51239 RepID=A0A835Q959_VANPL|nr:hypothetical protein HPP92_018036 [Vanilla planifolia]
MDSQKVEFPRVDLTGLLQVKSDSSCWKMAQEKVISALANYGGFEAVYGDVKPGLKTEFFENIMPKFMSDMSKVSYAHGRPPAVLFQHDLALKNLCINDPTSLSSVEDYVKSIWPKGNDLFCNSICNYAKHIQEVAQIIQRMILMSFNLEEDYESNKFMASSLILIEYVNDKAMDKSRIGMLLMWMPTK